MINAKVDGQIVPLDYQRFSKVLGMLVVSTDNALKLAAIGRANVMLDAAGLNWEEFVELSARSQRSAANDQIFYWPHSPRQSSQRPATPPPAQPAPGRNRLSGAAIPAYISGLVSIRQRRRTGCGEMLVIDLCSDTGTIYGPLAVFDARLIAALDSTSPSSFTGFVRQPARAINLPTLASDSRANRG